MWERFSYCGMRGLLILYLIRPVIGDDHGFNPGRGWTQEKASVLSLVLDGCRTEDVGAALDREGIAVRAGHHCAQPILRRFGLESTVRPSLAFYNTRDDVDALAAALQRIQSGRIAYQRCNANGVDLNRNFPAAKEAARVLHPMAGSRLRVATGMRAWTCAFASSHPRSCGRRPGRAATKTTSRVITRTPPPPTTDSSR